MSKGAIAKPFIVAKKTKQVRTTMLPKIILQILALTVYKMKKLTLLIICSWFSMLYTYSQDVIYKPEGALIHSLRNDGKSELYIPGCGNALKMDDMNNLYGDYWSFYLVGTVESLSDITVKPYCPASKIGLRKGCGYVGYCSRDDCNRGIYIRFYVTEMVTSTSNEIIGATLLYQTNYQSKDEMERAVQARAEREASKIFWNGDAVPDATLRKILLGEFDTDNDGKISQVEAAKKNSLQIQGGNRMAFYETGIGNLTGLTSLTFTETNITGEINPALPNLQRFVLQGNGPTISLLDLTGCQNIDTVKVGKAFIDKMNLRNCKRLRMLNFYSEYYTTINELLDVSGCTALKDCGLYPLRGKLLDFSENTGVLLFDIPYFNEINLSGCTSLNFLNGRETPPKGYELKKLNLERCNKLRTIDLDDSELTDLNLSDCKNLKFIYLKNHGISRLELSNLLELTDLSLVKMKLSELNLSKNRKLSSVTLDSTEIKTLDFSGMKHLNHLSCYDGKLEVLDLSSCDSLVQVNVLHNKLRTINLTGCTNIRELFCEKNELTSLNVSDCDSLFFLRCSDNPALESLDVSKNRELGWIQCSGTAIQELDISHSKVIEWASNEPGTPIVVPRATEGFKTLWVNEEQKVEWMGEDGNSYFKLIKDKDLDKSLLLNLEDEEISLTKADLSFKIKVRK